MEYTFDIDELIAKRLTQEIDSREDGLLEAWLAESSDNRSYFNQMQQLWKQAELGKNTLPRPLDVETALAKTKLKIGQSGRNGKAKVVGFGSWWMAAAAAIVLLAAAIWFFQPFSEGNPVVIAAVDTPFSDTLADGSIVAINQHSSISATFSKNERRIKMRGEVYFQVAHNKAKPFVIDVKQVVVTVIGTKFNINNGSDSTKVVVSVEEGKVKVQSGNQIIYLTAGEQASIDCQSGQIVRSKVAPTANVKGWFDHRFVFDDVPLSEVIPILEREYHVRIELKNQALGNCRLHTRFINEPIERILDLIAQAFSSQIENNNGTYRLDGAGCQ